MLMSTLVLSAHLVLGAPSKKAKKPSPRPPTPTASEAIPVRPTPALPDLRTLSTAALVTQARQQYAALEYDHVARLARAALQRTDLTLEQKLEASALHGSALAIVADPIDAEKPFRLLLRASPDFNLPDTTPPKIMAVFRKVQVEERAILEDFAAIARQRLIATLRLEGAPAVVAQGGRALSFRYRLRDPQGAADAIRVQYRRRGDPEFTSLPLRRDDEGFWSGRIPGEWTASEKDFTLEYFVVASDDRGPLVAIGSEGQPETIPVAAGIVDKNAHPVPTWGFWLAAGATGTAGVVAGVLAGATEWQRADYDARVAQATAGNPADGDALDAQLVFGNNLMVAQFVGWGVTTIGAVVTGVLIPFTNWSGEQPVLDEPDEEAPTGPGATPASSSTTAWWSVDPTVQTTTTPVDGTFPATIAGR
jgi:hypothetical protein